MPKRGPGRSSTVVCNHVGFMEICNQLCSPIFPSFTPKSQVQQIPIASGIAVALQSMYVERAGTNEERDLLVQKFI